MKSKNTPKISDSPESTVPPSFSDLLSNDLLTDIIRANLSEIFIFDAKTLRFLFVNDGALKNLGYSLAQIHQMTPVHLKPEFTEETFRAKIQPLLTHQITGLNFETLHRRSDGSRYPIEVQLQYYDHTSPAVFIAIIQNITDRKLAQEKTEHSIKLFNTVQRLAHIGAWEWNCETQTMHWSDEVFHIHGLQPVAVPPGSTEYIEKSISCYAPDDHTRITQAYLRCLQDGIPYELECRFTALDGTPKWVRTSAEAIWQDGRIVKVEGHIADITAQKQAELALRESEEVMRYIVKHDPNAIAVLDTEFRYIAASNRLLSDYNVHEEDVIGKFHYEVFPDLPQKFKHAHQQALKGIVSRQEDDPYQREDGTITYTTWECRPWYRADGRIGGIILYTEVTTPRKSTEIALRESEEMMRYIIKYDPNSIAVYDREMRYIAVSNRYLADYGVQEEDIIGKHHYEVFPDIPQRWREVHARVMQGAIEHNDDDYFIRTDGSTNYNRWECRPWYRANGEIGGIITYTEVITRRKLAEMQLKEQLEELRRWQAVMIGREDRILELKREVNELLQQMGQGARYPSAAANHSKGEQL